MIILDLAGERLSHIENTEGFAVIPCDLSQPEAIRDSVQTILAAHGHIDSLIQVAGLMRNADSFHISPKEWDKMFDINARATFFLAKEVVEQ